MKLTYLGTSAAEAFPAPFCECDTCKTARVRGGKNIRTRSHALVNDDLMLEFPPDAYSHILANGIDMGAVDNILITHCHEDHLYLHDLLLRRPDWVQYDTKHHMGIHGNDSLLTQVKPWREQPFFTGVEQSTTFQMLRPYHTVQIGHYAVTPLLADHNPNEQCYIYYIEQAGKGILYAHDTGWFPETSWNWLSGKRLSLVSLDCNHMLEEVSRNHMGLACCLRVREQLLTIGDCDSDTRFVLNHFSHNGRCCHEEFEKIAGNQDFLVSWDGLSLEF